MDSLRADFGSLPEMEQAKRTGKPVEIVGNRTPTIEMWANPDGTFRQDISAVPERVKVGNKWKQVDLDLVKSPDGSVRPKASSNHEVLSGGGKSPLLTSTFDGVTVSTTWPDELPSPSIDGATARYREVFPGVDLRMTVTDAGTSQVLVVKDRQAAKNPALRKLRTQTTAKGGLVRPAGKGGLSVVDGKGREVAAAQPAMMWDSRGTALSASNKELKRGTRAALLARTLGPAADDKVTKVPTTVTNTSVTLRPKADALAGDDVVYPVFIDPMSSPVLDVWLAIRQSPDTSYLKWTSDRWIGKNASYLQRMFWKFNVSGLRDAYISNARFSATLMGTSSCTQRQAKVWRTEGFGTSTGWSNQPAWNTADYQGSQTEAVNSSCNPYGKVVEFPVTDAIKKSSFEAYNFVTLGMRATDESNTSGFMFYDHHTTLSVTYSYRVRGPSQLSMSDPDVPCGGVIGGVKPRLTAELIDWDSENVLHNFQVFTGSSIPANPDTAPKFWEETGPAQSSGDGVGPATFTTAGRVEGPPDANGVRSLPNGTYTWRVRGIEAAGLQLEGLWSAPCTFTVRDGLVDPPGVSGLPGTWSLDAAPVDLTLTSPPNMAPVGGQDLGYYRWSLNADSPTSESVLPTTANGTASIKVKPTRAGTNVLRVWAYDNSGNRSLPYTYTFDTYGTTAAYSSRYLFNETPGSSTVADQMGQQNLTGVGAAGLKPRGIYRVAGSSTDSLDHKLVLTGAEDPPAKTEAPVINTIQSFTVSAWIDPTANGTSSRAAVSQGTATTSTFTLGVAVNCGATTTSSCYRFGVRTATGMQYVDSTRDPISDFAPGLVHVVGDVSVSATKTVARLRVVVDGQIQSKEMQLTGPPVASTGTGAGLLIGAARSASAYSDKFAGAIDDVMLKQGVLDDVGLVQLHAEDGGRCYTFIDGGGPLCAG